MTQWAGAIFVSALNDGDFHDLYNLTYWHHMDNGGMYGDVMEMLDEEYFEEHRTGQLILPDRSYNIELYAVMDCDAYNQMIYDVQGINADMAKFQNYLIFGCYGSC